MTPFAPPAGGVIPVGSRRHRRGRLLLVRAGAWSEALEATMPRTPLRAPDLFAAIGLVHAAPASEPIVALLVPGDVAPAPGRRALEAIRRLDPSVRLIRIETDGSRGAAPATEGWDAALAVPLGAGALEQALAAALGDGWLGPAPAGSMPVEAPRAGPAPAVESAREDAPPPRPAPTARADPGAAVGTGPSAPSASAQIGGAGAPPAPAPPETARPDAHEADEALLTAGTLPPWTPTEPLGDTDLVRAVMTDPRGVAPAALELIRRQTGWTDVALAAAADGAAPGRACATLHGADDAQRLLTTAMASPAELEPWARWLEQWLALDHSYRSHRRMAYHDELTGAWNRRYFSRFLRAIIEQARRRRRPVTVMVFDIDDFKRYNDEFSHEAGDVILRETVALLKSVIRASDRVCRIGGDEFAVVFADLDAPRETGSSHPSSVETIARRFQAQIAEMRFPKLGPEAPGDLTISGGLATFPWDGDDAEVLLRLADQRAMESKRRGKNHITFGPHATSGGEPSPPPPG